MVDKEKCLDLIENNTNIFRVHTFGLGYFDYDFIKRAGEKGSYNIIKDVSNLKVGVIQALNKTLRSYLYDAKIHLKNSEKKYEFIPDQKICYQD